jgi:hypothetical protein
MGKSPRRSLLMSYRFSGGQLPPNVRVSTSATRPGGALAVIDQAADTATAASLMDQLKGFFSKGGRKAGSPGFLGKVANVAKSPRGLTGLGALALLGSGLAAAEEFDGEDVGLDASQATGRFLGDFGTTAALAGTGALIGGPIGAVALPAVASLLQVQDRIGQGTARLGGGIYSGITGIVGESDDDKNRRNVEADELLKIKLAVAEAEAMAPVQQKIAEMNAVRQLENMEKQGQIQSRYNFRNTLNNQSLLASQQQANLQNILANNLY